MLKPFAHHSFSPMSKRGELRAPRVALAPAALPLVGRAAAVTLAAAALLLASLSTTAAAPAKSPRSASNAPASGHRPPQPLRRMWHLYFDKGFPALRQGVHSLSPRQCEQLGRQLQRLAQHASGPNAPHQAVGTFLNRARLLLRRANAARGRKLLGINSPTGLAVWFELNRPSYYVDFKPYARRWASLGTLIITSTPAHGRGIFQKMRQQVPTLIPGLKTAPVLGTKGQRLTDPAAWAKIARLANRYCRITGSRVCVLENESAFKPVRDHTKPFDAQAFKAAVASADWRCEIWWYPATVGESEADQRRSYEIARAVTKVIPNCHLVSTSLSGPASKTYGWSQRADSLTRELDDKAINIVYLGGKGQWPMKQTGKAVQVAGGRAVLYPGLAHMKQAVSVLAALAPPTSSTTADRGNVTTGKTSDTEPPWN